MVRRDQLLVASPDLSVDLRVPVSRDMVVFNKETGDRCSLSSEALKLLQAFEKPISLRSAAASLGVSSDDVEFERAVSQLSAISFLIEHTDEGAAKRHDAPGHDNSVALVNPGRTFANAPVKELHELEAGDVAIVGMPIDFGTSGSPGARLGAEKVREQSTNFVSFDVNPISGTSRGWPHIDFGGRLLSGVPIVDVGNIRSVLGEPPEDFYRRGRQVAATLFETGATPIFLGGDHSITAPIISACCAEHAHTTLVHFDAHTDLGNWTQGVSHHHGNVMSRILAENSNIEIVQIGIRGFAGDLPQDHRVQLIPQADLEELSADELQKLLPRGRTCYISIDIDVVDPAFAPGTGTPVPFGMQPAILRRLLKRICVQNSIVGMDLVELSPASDINDMTSSLCFHLLCDALGWASRDNSHPQNTTAR